MTSPLHIVKIMQISLTPLRSPWMKKFGLNIMTPTCSNLTKTLIVQNDFSRKIDDLLYLGGQSFLEITNIFSTKHRDSVHTISFAFCSTVGRGESHLLLLFYAIKIHFWTHSDS